MQIRPASSADIASIERLVQRAYEPYVARIGVRPAPMDDDYQEKVNGKAADVFVALDTEVVGILVLVGLADHMLLENVAVAPDKQGDGVGKALLAFAETRARKAGKPALRLYTNAAMTENIALYLRLGYEETGRDGENGYRRVFFVKRLEAAR